MKIVILTLVAVALVLSWHLDEINLLGTFLLAALMLGLIWWKWTIKKKKDKATRIIALRILDNLDGTRQHALGNLQQAGPNAQQRIKKAIGEELRRRPTDEIALMVLDGGPEMQELMGKILPQMPITIWRDIKRAIKEEGRRREEWVKTRRDINRTIEEERRRREAWEEEQERRRRETQERPPEAREIDRLFEGDIEQNTNEIALRFFSGEFQDREYVIKKIRGTNAQFQRRLAPAIRQTQNVLLNNPQALMPGNAFVYLIRQEYFAIEQFFFKIGLSNNPGRRLGEFQTGNPHLLHLWAAMSFPNDADAEQKEGELHEVCKAWREHGEWFQGHALKELLRVGRFAPYFNPQGPLI